MLLTSDEEDRIVSGIRKNYDSFVEQYDSWKYPEEPYLQFQDKFRSVSSVSCIDISQALQWKYGHWHKKNFPEAHKKLIRVICDNWEQFVAVPTSNAKAVFAFWSDKLEVHHSFITVCYLTHLVNSQQIAILDQHNYRAMNYWIRTMCPTWHYKKKPSTFSDLIMVSDFIQMVVDRWVTVAGETPDRRSVDKYLMVLGQKLKRVDWDKKPA